MKNILFAIGFIPLILIWFILTIPVYIALFFASAGNEKTKQERFFYAGLKNGMFLSQGEEGDTLSLPDLSPPKLFRDESVCKKAIANLLVEKGQTIMIYSILTDPDITPWRFWETK